MRVSRRIRKFVITVALLALVAGPVSAGDVTGTVKLNGSAPKPKPVRMDADPGCAAKHKSPVMSEKIVLGPNNTMANVFVKVVGGLPDKTWPVPSEPVVLDQDGCKYIPHVMGIMVGQDFRILNSDGLLHNVHALPEVNKQFNMAMPASRTEAVEKFTKAEGLFVIKCDVHPWMKAYVEVLEHPFYAVTDGNGKYTIKGLPAGTYQVEAWHELWLKLGPQKGTVKVGADGTQTLDFTFTPPSRN